MLKDMMKKLNENVSLSLMIKVIAGLVIIFLLQQTQSWWGNWLSVLGSILQPFIVGFMIAFILNPIVLFFTKKELPRGLAVALVLLICVVIITLFFMAVLPLLYDRSMQFMTSLMDGVEWIATKLGASGFGNQQITDTILNVIRNFQSSFQDSIPGVISSIPSYFSSIVNFVTNSLFSITIAIYMMLDFENVKKHIKKFIGFFYRDNDVYLHEMNADVSVYIRSLGVVMLIIFVEYSVFYYLVGHPDWAIMATLTAIGLLIPYIGGTLANVIGIITGLTLPFTNLIILIIGVCILSVVDGNVISPLVHEKRSSLGPLVTLLAVFAGGVLLGAIGIAIAVPVALIIRSIYRVYHEQHIASEDEEEAIEG